MPDAVSLSRFTLSTANGDGITQSPRIPVVHPLNYI